MAGENKGTTFLAVGAGIAAAIALLNTRRVSAGNTVSLDEATTKLLVAMAQSVQLTGEELEQLIADLPNLLKFPEGVGVVPNARTVSSFTVRLLQVNTPVQLAPLNIPDTMALVFKSWPIPINVAGSFIYIGTSPQFNIDAVYPLIPNETYPCLIKNADAIYLSTNIAGSAAVISAEQR